MTVVYEWDVEEVTAVESDEHEEGEVLEHFHQTCYADALAFSRTQPAEGCKYELVLVRDDDNGRSWAYCNEDGTLPSHFEDAYNNETAKVPKRFVVEVARVIEKKG
jgi:hypothetical protein